MGINIQAHLDLRELSSCYTDDAMEKPKNAAAQALAKLRAESMTPAQRSKQARKAGLAGGAARAKKLSKAKRKAIAKNAAEARWGKKNAK
jgi:hypothetical protein